MSFPNHENHLFLHVRGTIEAIFDANGNVCYEVKGCVHGFHKSLSEAEACAVLVKSRMSTSLRLVDGSSKG